MSGDANANYMDEDFDISIDNMKPPGVYRMQQQLTDKFVLNRILQESSSDVDINYGSPVGGQINVRLVDKNYNDVDLKLFTHTQLRYFVPIQLDLKNQLIANATTYGHVTN